MIHGEATEQEMEILEEAGAFSDVAHMPARVKCAVLGWHTLREMLNNTASARRKPEECDCAENGVSVS